MLSLIPNQIEFFSLTPECFTFSERGIVIVTVVESPWERPSSSIFEMSRLPTMIRNGDFEKFKRGDASVALQPVSTHVLTTSVSVRRSTDVTFLLALSSLPASIHPQQGNHAQLVGEFG